MRRRSRPRSRSLGRIVLAAGSICALLLAFLLVSDRGVQGGYLVAAPGSREDLADFERDVRAVKEHGGTWVRFGVRAYDVVVDWDRDGAIRFDAEGLATVDAALDLATAAGLEVYLVTADTVPEEAVARSGRPYLEIMTEYWQHLAERFGDRVALWQVFNEADGGHFRTGDSLGGELPPAYLEELALVLERAASTIRAAAPRVDVTTTAGGYPVDNAMEEHWGVFFAAVGGPLDVVAVGLYPQVDQPAISSLSDRLERLRDRVGKPVVVAELGLQTCPECFSEADQGTYIAASLRELRSAPVRAVLVYELRDSDRYGFGILHRGWTPKTGAQEIGESLRRL